MVILQEAIIKSIRFENTPRYVEQNRTIPSDRKYSSFIFKKQNLRNNNLFFRQHIYCTKSTINPTIILILGVGKVKILLHNISYDTERMRHTFRSSPGRLGR